MRKKVVSQWTLGVGLGCLLMSGYSAGHNDSTCAERRDEILYQLDQAKLSGNRYKQSGLETALRNVKRYCQDDPIERRQNNIASAAAEVIYRSEQLERALEEDAPSKVKVCREQLHHARRQLARATES